MRFRWANKRASRSPGLRHGAAGWPMALILGAGVTMSGEAQVPGDAVRSRPVEVDGMRFGARRTADLVRITLSAPTAGWIAVGFNTQNDIVGADLKMFAVVNGRLRHSDQFVTGPGRHPEKASLGGTPGIRVLSFSQSAGRTTVRFELPARPRQPRYDFDHTTRAAFYLILAYSVDDDFQHHSRVRRHLRFAYDR